MSRDPLTSPLGATATFRLSVLGAETTRRFVAAVEDLGVKPKDVGLLVLLEAGEGRSQRELAAAMHVAPSLVVVLVDELEALGAVQRVRASDDRRRQQIVLTAAGRTLLAACADRARALDADLLADLDPHRKQILTDTLGDLLVPLTGPRPQSATGDNA